MNGKNDKGSASSLVCEKHQVPYSKLVKAFLEDAISSKGTKFSFYFSYFNEPEFVKLKAGLEHHPQKMELIGLLKTLQSRLQREAVSEARITTMICSNLELCRKFYADFVDIHTGKKSPFYNEELMKDVEKNIVKAVHRRIYQCFATFNACVLKTNFYKEDKSGCFSYRIQPSFFNNTCYPDTPFAIFLFLDYDFVGFHVRFSDIARGGVRIIRSPTPERYLINSRSVFDEQYDLARTQHAKNKELPEGGSKATILLSLDYPKHGEVAFQKLVDGLLDLIIENGGKIIDHYRQKEVIFLGPDEGTAEYMGWACLRAKERGYKYWKTLCTGKSPDIGGIPHDIFGMTTAGIHEYVLSVLKEHGEEESEMIKAQTGGPDGDLGSNEIKISKDKTCMIVDGGGVGYDPKGLNREELLRLANKRQTIKEFNKKLLSKDGFVVTVDEKNVTLPSGEVVESGFAFRNGFHFHPLFKGDLFVPCGGRPKSVSVSNVKRFFDGMGKPRFKYIIEGANLFFTDESREVLEKAGVVLFKDASANKGGVTSSSMEVLCGLALSDEEYSKLMMRDGEKAEFKPFYKKYVNEVLKRIKSNARSECKCITKIRKETGMSSWKITEIVSNKINELANKIKDSDLYNDKEFIKNVLVEALPKLLLKEITYEKIITRVPVAYLKSLVGSYLASQFIFKFGVKDDCLMDFYNFISEFLRKRYGKVIEQLQKSASPVREVKVFGE